MARRGARPRRLSHAAGVARCSRDRQRPHADRHGDCGGVVKRPEDTGLLLRRRVCRRNSLHRNPYHLCESGLPDLLAASERMNVPNPPRRAGSAGVYRDLVDARQEAPVLEFVQVHGVVDTSGGSSVANDYCTAVVDPHIAILPSQFVATLRQAPVATSSTCGGSGEQSTGRAAPCGAKASGRAPRDR